MKHVTVILFAYLSMFAFCGTSLAQATASISPNNINAGQTTDVTLQGLQANTTYTVKFAGVGEGGTEFNAEREVTTDANGKASWTETISWGADSYATNVSWRQGGGQPTNTTAGTLIVSP